MRRALLLAALALAAVLAGCATGGPAPATKVVLAIQPTDNAASIMSQASELEAFLEERMKAHGAPADVEIEVPLTYVGVVEAFRYEHVDAALMGAWPAVMATQRADAEIVLAERREVIHGDDATVAPYYYSYFVVPRDSPIETLEDLRGKRVAFPSTTSTSGYVFPLAKLVDEGLVPTPANGTEAKPDAFFGEVAFAGGYAQAWEALKRGQVDVAVTAGDVNAKLYGEVRNGTRVVAQMGPIPSHAVVFADDLTGSTRDALKAALLDLKDDKRDLMRKLVSGIFVEFQETTTAEHAAGLEVALRTTGLRMQEKL